MQHRARADSQGAGRAVICGAGHIEQGVAGGDDAPGVGGGSLVAVNGNILQGQRTAFGYFHQIAAVGAAALDCQAADAGGCRPGAGRAAERHLPGDIDDIAGAGDGAHGRSHVVIRAGLAAGAICRSRTVEEDHRLGVGILSHRAGGIAVGDGNRIRHAFTCQDGIAARCLAIGFITAGKVVQIIQHIVAAAVYGSPLQLRCRCRSNIDATAPARSGGLANRDRIQPEAVGDRHRGTVVGFAKERLAIAGAYIRDGAGAVAIPQTGLRVGVLEQSDDAGNIMPVIGRNNIAGVVAVVDIAAAIADDAGTISIGGAGGRDGAAVFTSINLYATGTGTIYSAGNAAHSAAPSNIGGIGGLFKHNGGTGSVFHTAGNTAAHRGSAGGIGQDYGNSVVAIVNSAINIAHNAADGNYRRADGDRTGGFQIDDHTTVDKAKQAVRPVARGGAGNADAADGIILSVKNTGKVFAGGDAAGDRASTADRCPGGSASPAQAPIGVTICQINVVRQRKEAAGIISAGRSVNLGG